LFVVLFLLLSLFPVILLLLPFWSLLPRVSRPPLVSLLQAKQLERKERELATISAFYKEQLETLEKKVRMIR
jgi:hypothetical protein